MLLQHDDFLLQLQDFLLQSLFILLEQSLLVVALPRELRLHDLDKACVLLQSLLMHFFVQVYGVSN